MSTTPLIVDLTCGTKQSHVDFVRKKIRPTIEYSLDGGGLQSGVTSLIGRASFTKAYLDALTNADHIGWYVITDVCIDPSAKRSGRFSEIGHGRLALRRIERVGGFVGPGEPLF